MSDNKEVIHRLLQRLQQCIKDEGIEFEVQHTDHEATIAAREVHGSQVRIVVHITDRDAVPSAHGLVSAEVARARLVNAVVRPSLSRRSATRLDEAD